MLGPISRGAGLDGVGGPMGLLQYQHHHQSMTMSHVPPPLDLAAIHGLALASELHSSPREHGMIPHVPTLYGIGDTRGPMLAKKSKKPEFLIKLYKMLQQEDSAIIQWDNGRIHVHDPKTLGAQVLHKYFRHSKYSSFQRQLNYFGFRKTQGKGKMAACTYTNFDLTNASLKSLLKIKRKTNSSTSPAPMRHSSDEMWDSKDSVSVSSHEGGNSPEHHGGEDRLLFLYQLAAAEEKPRSHTPVEEAPMASAPAPASTYHQREAPRPSSSMAYPPYGSFLPSASSAASAPTSVPMVSTASHLSVSAPPPMKQMAGGDSVPPPPITPSSATEVHVARWGPVREMQAI